MITTPSGRRAAEQFDDLLEGRITEASGELTDLIEFAERVWAVPVPTPRADFTASLRERLMAEAPAALADAPTDSRLTVNLPAATRRGPRRLAAAVAVLSVAGAATGTAFASEGALPGDTLYPVKRLVESAHAAISFGDEAKGGVELDRATTRLEEATKLADAGDTSAAADALSDFVSQAAKGSDLLTTAGQGKEIHTFTTSSVTGLASLSGLLPSDVLAPVLQALLDIDKATTAKFPDAGDGISELPTALSTILASTVGAVTSPLTGGTTAKPGAKLAPAAGSSTAPAPLKSNAPAPATGGPGGTGGTAPKPKPTSLGDAVGDLGDTVGGDVLGGVGDGVKGLGSALPSPIGGIVGGVGDTVGGVGDTVGGVLGGLGGLLNGGTGK